METPKSATRNIKPRKHVPTPKMSDRKKALFTPRSSRGSPSTLMKCDSDDDSDLGILSPLQCSSSPLRYDSDDSTPTLFSGSLLGKKSIRSIQSRYSDSGKYELLPSSIKPTLSDLAEETETMITPKKLQLTNSWIDVSQITDLSAPIILLTPGDTTTKEKIPKSSFRKSLIDNDINKTPHVENDGNLKRQRSMEEEKDSKARTSLFNESISTKSFYSHNTSVETDKDESLNCSILEAIRKTSKIVPLKQIPRKQKRVKNRTTKRKDINRGVFHKIHKPTIRSKVKKSNKANIAKMSKEQLLETAINIIENSPLNSYLNSSQEEEMLQDKRKRVQQLLKNINNPIELARPLNIELPHDNSINSTYSDLEECENGEPLLKSILNPSNETQTNKENRKFFKSKTDKKAKYEIMKGISAVLDQGKLTLETTSKVKPKKRKLRSLFDDDLEFNEEHQEVNHILKNMEETASPLKERPSNNDFNLMSPTTTQISRLASKFAAMKPVSSTNPAMEDNSSNLKLFPVFNKNENNKPATNVEPEPKRVKVNNEWRPIGENQLQIDAGQKAFGAIECKTCGFIYTQHVPEDEQLHQQFHNSCQILNFKGWEKENRVLDVYEWGVTGRVISISNLDSKIKVNRAHEILKLADMELGFAQIPLHHSAIIYLACNSKEIMGVCVAQPLSEANKIISDYGIDFCSSETYPVKCGISRIWVNAKHRRKGVATKLFEAVKCNFLYGYRMSTEEIAFSAPTEMGKTFAEKVTRRNDFLVYQ
uniref:CSON006352 protein n=1 Tax=Culicoides sonorensis TaxID=179676 RepID=A0A336KG68_CULSO